MSPGDKGRTKMILIYGIDEVDIFLECGSGITWGCHWYCSGCSSTITPLCKNRDMTLVTPVEHDPAKIRRAHCSIHMHLENIKHV
jgi:hypothetical protein